ncbi:MAG TPA: hypothetical protein VJ782_05105 [Aeromicrobium sp.]|nr:hypothetical protein [Aeromicrobium sp.]
MTTSPVIFGDPEALLIGHLVTAFAARTETYKATSVGIGFPAASGYHVQVELEVGNADAYPVTERAQVRVNCWAPKGKRSDVKDLASLTMALVNSYDGDAEATGAHVIGGRSAVIPDPDSGYLMCWFLARVNLKATLLAS